MIRNLVYKRALVVLNILVSLLFHVSFLLLPMTKRIVNKALTKSGIDVHGKNACDPKVKDNRFYCDIFARGMTGIPFAYEKGYFECDDILSLFIKVYTIENFTKYRHHPYLYLHSLLLKWFFAQSDETDDKGYDEKEGVFGADTDPDTCITISNGYWRTAANLEESYAKKLDLVARKLKLSGGMHVLDVGSGEGTLLKILVDNYDVTCVGINVDKRQNIKARKLCQGLKVQIKDASWTNVNGLYDRIVCIRTLEHFGYSNIRPFFERMHRCLAKDGLLLLEVSLNASDVVPAYEGFVSESFKCYFPLTSQFCEAIDGLFVVQDCQNASHDYYLTFKAEIEKKKSKKEKLETSIGTSAYRRILAHYSVSTSLQKNNCTNVYIIVLSKFGYSNNNSDGGYQSVV